MASSPRVFVNLPRIYIFIPGNAEFSQCLLAMNIEKSGSANFLVVTDSDPLTIQARFSAVWCLAVPTRFSAHGRLSWYTFFLNLLNGREIEMEPFNGLKISVRVHTIGESIADRIANAFGFDILTLDRLVVPDTDESSSSQSDWSQS